jgi:hypothetical protein
MRWPETCATSILPVEVLPGVRFLDQINDNKTLIVDSFVLPAEAPYLAPPPLRFLACQTVANGKH